MSILQITKAVRQGSPVIIDIYGYSGSGKTLSALLIARGLAGPKGKIGMLDTERGRGKIYAGDPDVGDYDYAELTAPFTPERYIEAIDEFEKGDYAALIVDSSSHEWDGLGGVLDVAGESKAKGLLKWANPKARHKKFVQRLLRSKMHLILCVRAKEKFVQKMVRQDDGTMKEVIVSEGMIPIQEKSFVFETSVQLFLPVAKTDADRGRYVVEKCPRALLGAFPGGEKITVQTGRMISEWVAGGVPVDTIFETAKHAGEAAAEKGMAALQAWWGSAEAKPHQRRLLPFMDNLKSIAATTDEEKVRAADPERVDEPDRTVADPFAEPSKPLIVNAQTGEIAPKANGAGNGAHAPPSPLTLTGKAAEEAWPAWSTWFRAELAAAPKVQRPDVLKKYGREFAAICERRTGDMDAINEILDRPE